MKTTRIVVTVPVTLKARLDNHCKAHYWTVSSYVRRVIEAALKADGAK